MTTATSSTFTAATAAAQSATSTSASAGAATKLAGDMQSFLVMLTTQLKNQDPMQPLDPNQFTSQLSQFASVEQQIASNKNMETLLEVQRSAAMLSAAPMVGKQVEVSSTKLALEDGTTQTVKLPATTDAGGAAMAVVSITDNAGTLLRQTRVPLSNDPTSWKWDGRGSDGKALANGSYNIAVQGLDAYGAATSALDFTVTGTLDRITRAGTEPKLNLGALNVGMEALRGL